MDWNKYAMGVSFRLSRKLDVSSLVLLLTSNNYCRAVLLSPSMVSVSFPIPFAIPFSHSFSLEYWSFADGVTSFIAHLYLLLYITIILHIILSMYIKIFNSQPNSRLRFSNRKRTKRDGMSLWLTLNSQKSRHYNHNISLTDWRIHSTSPTLSLRERA